MTGLAIFLAIATTTAVAVASFALGRITSPHRPRPGGIDVTRVAAAVLELQYVVNQHADELARQQDDLDTIYARRRLRHPPPHHLDRGRQPAIDTTGVTAQHNPAEWWAELEAANAAQDSRP